MSKQPNDQDRIIENLQCYHVNPSCDLSILCEKVPTMFHARTKKPIDTDFDTVAQLYTILNDKIGYNCTALEQIIKKNFNINYKIPRDKCNLSNIVGCTVLDFALKNHNLEAIKILAKHGGDFTDKNDSGNTILHRVIEKYRASSRKGKLRNPFVDTILTAHIEQDKPENPCNEYGISHFHIACMYNHSKAIEYFLANGIDINEAINSDSPNLPGYTPLHIAARYLAYDTVKMLLNHGANPNLTNNQNMYPLYSLIERKREILNMVNVKMQNLGYTLNEELLINEAIIKLFLDKIDTEKVPLTRCQVACTLQDSSIIEQMIKDGVDLNDSVNENSRFYPGYTPLHFAAQFNLTSFQFLIENEADIFAKDSTGQTPFDLCLLPRYSIEVIDSLMKNVVQWENITFSDGKTKLADVINGFRDEDEYKKFSNTITKNINMKLPDDSPLWPGYTILHVAVTLFNGIFFNRDQLKVKIIRDLCSKMHADVNIKDIHNSTPLHLAFRQQNRHIVNVLLNYCNDKIENVIDDKKLSHLHIACAAGKNNAVKKLLSNKDVDVNQPIMTNLEYQWCDEKEDEPNVIHITPGWTCLHIAVATSDEKLVAMLMKHNINLHSKDDKFGMTAIHQILQADCKDCGLTMLSSRNLENHVTSFGLNHLHVACFVGDLEAVKKLIDLKADIEETVNYNQIRLEETLLFLASYDGYKPIHFALREQNYEVVKYLVMECKVNLFTETANGSCPFYDTLKCALKNIEFDDNYSNEDYNYFNQFPNYDGNDDYNDDVNDYHEYDEMDSTFALKFISDEEMQKIVEQHMGLTRLHIACLGLNRKKVSKLLKEKADPNARIHESSAIWGDYTPLHLLMTSRFSDESQSSKDPFVSYEVIVKIGKMLLAHDADVTLTDVDMNTPIHKASELLWSLDSAGIRPRFSNITWILKGHKDFDTNPVNARGISHFDLACMSNKHEIVEKFIIKGVNLNRRFGHFTDRYGGFTALHAASFYKNASVVKMLLKYGASTTIRDFLGNTPLHTVAVCCEIENDSTLTNSNDMFSDLIRAGADINVANLWNVTPLALILRMKKITTETFSILTKNQRPSRLNIFDLVNEKGLLGTCMSFDRDIEIYKVMTTRESVNPDEMGRTVIHNVVSASRRFNNIEQNWIEQYTEYISLLTKLDCDVNLQDNTGETALHKAAHFGNYEGIVGLLANGADINVVDDDNKTPLACSMQRDEENEEIQRKIFEAFLLHVYKLGMIGLDVSEANLQLISQIRCKITLCLNDLRLCVQELEKLRIQLLLNETRSITMYDFMSRNNGYFNMIRENYGELNEIFSVKVFKLRAMFPQFIGILLLQYRSKLYNSELDYSAKCALSEIAQCELPDLCSSEIIKFLDREDLKRLIEATRF